MYHRFGEIQVYNNHPAGYDNSRNVQVDGSKLDIHLQRFREVFSSKNWLVRIYEVLPEPNREKSVAKGIEGRQLI